MYAFTFERPASTADAVKLAGNGGAKLLAGGQTLLASMKLRLANPEQLVDLGGIAELSGVRKDGNALVIGAMTRHAEVATNADVKSALPALADLAGGIGDRQVRAMGTIGGSVANNDPSACYPAALLALGATVITNQRKIAADDFFQGMFTTALKDGELITGVSFPTAKKAAYIKFKQPASRFALIGVFVAQTDSGVRVAVTGGGNGVFRHKGLEDALAKSFTPEAAAAVKVDPATMSSDLHASAAYRANLVSVMTQRAVAKALG
ncbi:xanthine dehydrogenase family protein subunit M [Caenimonas sedimenti]|uniref:Xanthine dehydrogenase family protein subunit M n=1 Tax=Caenimonas sedimenti TaxID=2596921 RepID=A0A562ZII6_9BURK|nr:xanthine dehydrogenase family protein subunit M [Caenimonas sedimenti]TWO68392.1 xanthine dehydrogenase family protein subunit M [Caenimonas sedimenti]